MSNPVYNGSDKRLQQLFQNGGGGGGGTTVVANPSGEATDELEKLQVGQTIYDIPTGGGGGGYSETVLWSNSSGATAGTVTLSDNISHYDMLVFETSNSGIDETVHSQVVVPVSMIDTTGTNAFGASNVGGGENYVQLFRYVSDTSISLAWWTGSAPLKYYKIIGIKLSGSGGDGSSTLAGLTDVELTSPTDGQVLTYNNGEWVNDAGGSGGSGGMCYLNTIYSTTEKKVGYWEDGKPLYQLTVELSSEALIQTNSWYTTSISNANINNIIFANGINAEGSQFPLMANCDATGSGVNYVQIGNPRYGDIRIKTFTIQYTKTTDSAEPNPQQGGVIYLPTIYSEEEREVGAWTDGKPLYQKVVNCGTLPNTTSKNIAHGISNLDTLVKLSIFSSDGSTRIVIPHASTNAVRWQLDVYADNTNIVISAGADRTAFTDTYAVLQYTKTTDTAGSGSWTPSGANAVHYSTNEQVVGTWIDGKTLYEATIEVNNPTKQTFGNYYSYDANYSGHNIDYVQCIAKQCHDAHEQRWYDLPYHRIIDTESIWCQGMKSDSTGQYSFAVFFRTSEQYSIDKIRYTIQYTKTS